MTQAQITALIEEKILTGGRRTRADGLREVLEALNSAAFANSSTFTTYESNPLLRVYSAGETAIYNDKAYICISPTSGAFDIYSWEEFSYSQWGDIIGDINDQTDLIELINSNWSITGNQLLERASFGSTDSIFGWDWIVNDTKAGSVENDLSWVFGDTAAFADTFMSIKTQGDTNATYARQTKNFSGVLIEQIDNIGNNFVQRDVFVLGDGTSSKVDFFPSSPDMYYIGRSGTSLNLVANNIAQYSGASGTYRIYIGPSTKVFEIDSNFNFGFNGTSFGSGNGVMFLAEAGAEPSTSHAGGSLLWSKSGALNNKSLGNDSSTYNMIWRNSDNNILMSLDNGGGLNLGPSGANQFRFRPDSGTLYLERYNGVTWDLVQDFTI